VKRLFGIVGAFAIAAIAFPALIFTAAPASATSNVSLCNDSGTYCIQNNGAGTQYTTQNLTSTTFSTTGYTVSSGGHTYYQWEDNSGQCLGSDDGSVIAAVCADSNYEVWYFDGHTMVNLGNGGKLETDPVGNGADVYSESGTFTDDEDFWSMV
jgi:hypothetical protein